MRTLLMLSSILLITSCATSLHYQQAVQSWQGGQASQLMQQFGQPDEIISTQNGKTLLIYKMVAQQPATAFNPTPATVTIDRGKPVIITPPSAANRESVVVTCKTTFEIAPNHTILSTKVEGQGCMASEHFAKTMSNPEAR